MSKKRYKMTMQASPGSYSCWKDEGHGYWSNEITLEELGEPVSPLPDAAAQPTKEDPVEKVAKWLNNFFEENESWDDLSGGMTDFYKIKAQQLLAAGLDAERLK